MRHLDRIARQPGVMGGKPRTRVAVGMIAGRIGAGRRLPLDFATHQ
jgi:uncharacterized protein (DUF433 family)